MREISRLESAPQPLQIIDAETARCMMPAHSVSKWTLNKESRQVQRLQGKELLRRNL